MASLLLTGSWGGSAPRADDIYRPERLRGPGSASPVPMKTHTSAADALSTSSPAFLIKAGREAKAEAVNPIWRKPLRIEGPVYATIKIRS